MNKLSRQIPMDQALTEEDREYLESRGRNDLISQIDDNYPPDNVEDEEPTGGSSSEAERENLVIQESEDDYDSMTNDDLREELEDRDLPTGGNKAELIARLRENDAAE